MRQIDRHCKTVRCSVKTAEGVTDGVYIADAAAGKRTSRVESRFLHVLTRFQIVSVQIDLIEIMVNQTNRVFR